MKEYKWLLVGIITVLLIILLGIFFWLWSNNQKNIDPLPIMVNENASTDSSIGVAEDADDSVAAKSVLYLQVEDSLQEPIEDIIARFESRYPNIQARARYVPATVLLDLPTVRPANPNAAEADTNGTSASTIIKEDSSSPYIASVDMIIANNSLKPAQLSSLQMLLDEAQSKLNANQINTTSIEPEEDTDSETTLDATKTDNNESRTLTSFSYAIKGAQAVDGVILTDNSAAVSFRNFLLSSAGQDILEQYDYNNIDGYKNSMDELFNPLSSNDTDIEVEDLLRNSE